MRLTSRLNKQSFTWYWNNLWKNKGVLKEPASYVPKYVEKKGIPVVSAKDVISPVVQYEKWQPSVPDDPRWQPEPTIEDHPDYHEDPVYSFGQLSRLLEGEKQALILSKATRINGLPANINNLIDAVEIPGQDKLMQRYIMQAHLWDPAMDKLPKRFNTQLPGWHFKREHGVRVERTIHLLLSNILRLCQSLGGRYPDLLENRRVVRDSHLSAFYNYKDHQIRITDTHPFLVSSNRPLPAFASEDQVDATVTYKVPDLYPVSPTIDLRKEHVYQENNVSGWPADYSHGHPHTFFITKKDFWSTSQRNARALMFCLGQCVAQAKHRFGADVTHLPEPISVQCIHTGNGIDFHFACFQLNTMNFQNEEGVKNLAWFDNDNALFNKILPKRALLRNTKYEDYNPLVLRKILACWINGAKLD